MTKEIDGRGIARIGEVGIVVGQLDSSKRKRCSDSEGKKKQKKRIK